MKTKNLFILMVLTSMLLSCNVNNEKEQQSLAEVTKQELATALNERDQLLSLEIGRASCRERVWQLV